VVVRNAEAGDVRRVMRVVRDDADDVGLELAAPPAPEEVEQAVVVASGLATCSSKSRSSSSRRARSPSRWNSIRMKKVPPSGSVECWSELRMFASWSERKPETAATMPCLSGHDTSSRAMC
jgi:hypothetical protein